MVHPNQWQLMTSQHPDVAAGSTNKYQSWEVVDPESGCRTATSACVWIHGAAAARRETSIISHRARQKIFYNCIEWAGIQPWSNGKVGLNGISYYAINQSARGVASTAAPGGDVHLGRRR